jgi:hypothetical protein
VTSRMTPQCAYCAHYRSPIGSGGESQTCAAFPDGIPDDMWSNRFDHRRPFDGDGGVLWEPVVEGKGFPEWVLRQE